MERGVSPRSCDNGRVGGGHTVVREEWGSGLRAQVGAQKTWQAGRDRWGRLPSFQDHAGCLRSVILLPALPSLLPPRSHPFEGLQMKEATCPGAEGALGAPMEPRAAPCLAGLQGFLCRQALGLGLGEEPHLMVPTPSAWTWPCFLLP